MFHFFFSTAALITISLSIFPFKMKTTQIMSVERMCVQRKKTKKERESGRERERDRERERERTRT